MIRRSNKHGRRRGHGRDCTRLVAGLTPGDVPAGEHIPVDEGIVESSMHGVVQQAPGNALDFKQSIDRLAQIMTTVVQNQAQPHVGQVNTIERVRSLGVKSFPGSGDPPETESWLIKLERIFDMMRC